MINFTLHRSEEATHFSACSLTAADIEETKCAIHANYFASVNVIFSITSLLGNILVLTALQKETSLHPPSKLLFRCLSCTDLCVGLISQPIFTFYHMTIVNKDWELCEMTESLAFISAAILCGESITTLTAISVDRLLALLSRLRYRQIVTLNRVRLFVIISWIGSILSAMTYLWNKFVFFMGSCAWILLLVCISSCCYLKIYVSLRRRQTQVHGSQVNAGASLNIVRYKKTVSSALWIHLTLVVCYLPYTIATAVSILHSLRLCSAIAWNITGILVFINSSLNPFLYCWKLREVRQAVKQTIRQWLCLS